MSGSTDPNVPTFGLNAASVTARNAEYSGTPLSDTDGDGTTANPYLGMNRAGSNAPGIGISTGLVSADVVGDLTPDKWTLEDQAELARDPQLTQHLGGDGLGDGDATAHDINVADDVAVDYNDTMSFAVADTAAVDGAVAVVGALPGQGMINDTGETIAIGNVLWGKVPVA